MYEKFPPPSGSLHVTENSLPLQSVEPIGTSRRPRRILSIFSSVEVGSVAVLSSSPVERLLVHKIKTEVEIERNIAIMKDMLGRERSYVLHEWFRYGRERGVDPFEQMKNNQEKIRSKADSEKTGFLTVDQIHKLLKNNGIFLTETELLVKWIALLTRHRKLNSKKNRHLCASMTRTTTV